jgi:hypothetical protein
VHVRERERQREREREGDKEKERERKRERQAGRQVFNIRVILLIYTKFPSTASLTIGVMLCI